MTKVFAALLCLGVLTTSCSTTHRARQVRFDEQERADFIVRYYTDDTSYVLKPAAMDGRFLAVLRRDAALEMAKQQPNRALAVIVMIDRGSKREVEFVRQKWEGLLTEAGYQRVVFLRARRGMDVNGLPVLAYGG